LGFSGRLFGNNREYPEIVGSEKAPNNTFGKIVIPTGLAFDPEETLPRVETIMYATSAGRSHLFREQQSVITREICHFKPTFRGQ
jgi:hypothetical protein